MQHEHIRQDKDHRRGPSGEQSKDDLRTLLDDVDLIRPDKIHIVQTDVQREIRREEHKHRAAERHEKSGGKSGAKSDRRAHGGKDRARRGEEELHAAFGAQRRPCVDGQRPGDPERLAFERHARHGHIVHRADETHRRREQHRHGAVRLEHALERSGDNAAAEKQQNARNGQQKRTQAAVQHIIRAAGEAAELFSEHGGKGALSLRARLAVDLPVGLAGRGANGSY